MINEQTREHEIRCKIKLGIALSRKEESYYLLYMATHTERYQYIKSKKGGRTMQLQKQISNAGTNDNTSGKLTNEQLEYFKHSRVRDEYGRLIVVCNSE